MDIKKVVKEEEKRIKELEKAEQKASKDKSKQK